MKLFLESKARKAGAAPGVLLSPEVPAAHPPRLARFSYSADEFTEDADVSFDDALKALSGPGRLWLDLTGLGNSKMLQDLGAAIGIHALVLEDMASPGNRAKVEDHGDYLFVVLDAARWEADSLSTNQISLIIGSGFVFTCHDAGEPVSFAAVRERLKRGKGRIRKQGADYLAYALVDAVVDDYFSVLDQMAERLEDIDENVSAGADNSILSDLHQARRQLIDLRRTVWPIRDMLLKLTRTESNLFADDVSIFFRDVYDHVVEISDILDSFRDMTSTILDNYHSIAAQGLNEVMKFLTLVATIFIPLTFIAGIYGMNFEWMPELKYKWGYFIVLGVMLLLFLGMAAYFKKKKWF